MTMNEADSEIRTKGSLCSGTGALDAATPGEVAWVAETNPGAMRVLKREHPEVPNFGDITTTDWNYRQHHVDLLDSGDPCQSLSAAGRQLASDDARFLWPHVMDIIDKIRPHHLFLENVQNIVSVPLVKGGERGGVLKLRLDNLREAGYAVKWTVLGACAVGAPHHRHRWFLRARYVGGTPAAERILNKCGAPRTGGRLLLPTPRARGWKGGALTDRPGRFSESPDLPSALMALLPTPTTADGGGGPGTSDKRTGGMNLRTVVHHLIPTPRATDIGTPGRRSSEGWRPQLGQAVRETWGKFAPAVALWEEITGAPVPAPTVPAPRGGVRLNPELSEWMMGLPKGYATGELERNEALRAIGNGVVTMQARAAWDQLA